jgi:hypothetical protein
MSKYKKVSKNEFYQFIDKYPEKLEIDICHIPIPPIATFNDFSSNKKWPESTVAKIELFRNENKNIYFLLK